MTELSLSEAYAAAIQYLYGRINYEQNPPAQARKLTLEHMRMLLERLGDPHRRLPAVHIAGTKGKGSTAAMISSVLTCSGYRTGLYTSPHLTSLEERYSVDGTHCTREELIELTESVRPAVEAVDRNISETSPNLALTFFEITTAMMWLHFLRKKADIAVLEVGMGGRLDSTNLCSPLVSVITSISFDHTKQLGNTLAEIAREKAGIIKAGVPVVSGVEQAEASAVIVNMARSRQAPLLRLGTEFSVRRLEMDAMGEPQPRRNPLPGNGELGRAVEVDCQPEGKTIVVDSPGSTLTYRDHLDGVERCFDRVRVGMLGQHQAQNAGVAIAALACLQKAGWNISDEAIRSGLAKVRCPARIEIVRRDPTIILDTAHNVASIAALVATLDEQPRTGERFLIFAASRDKDVTGMLRIVLPHFDTVMFTQFLTNPRSIPVEQLEAAAKQVIGETLPGKLPIVKADRTPEGAWRQCRELLQPRDLVCITGSFFLAGEMQFVKQLPIE